MFKTMDTNVHELILEYLRNEGYRPNVDDDGDINFKCTGLTFLVLKDDNDEDFIRICLPYICEVNDDNRIAVLEACHNLCLMRKVIKAFIVNNHVWVVFEILADSTPEVSDFVPRAIDMLQQGREFFYKSLQQ